LQSSIRKAPKKIPTTVIIKEYFPHSIAGIISPQILAASITPDAKESIILLNFIDGFFRIKPISAPKIVEKPTPIALKKTISINTSIFILCEVSFGVEKRKNIW
jgi:hypothetical protein